MGTAVESGNDDGGGPTATGAAVSSAPAGCGNCRRDFPFFAADTPNPVYLDNAATTQKPRCVLDRLQTYYREENANVHRGLYDLSSRATQAYEAVRQKVADWLSVPDSHAVIFTRGTTESINLVAYSWARRRLQPGDEILCSEMEHHSNLVPWQLAARETGARLALLPVTSQGELDPSALQEPFTGHTRLLALTHQSNVLGTINPIADLIQRARRRGIVTVIDAAQSVPHLPVRVDELEPDFLAFSGHKMFGPTGVGVLVGRKELLETMDPFLAGGEMIRDVGFTTATWNEVPYKFEAGTPNIAQVIGLGAAVDFLQELGMESVRAYEETLTEAVLELFQSLPEATLVGSAAHRGPVFSFALKDIHPQDAQFVLNKEGIAVRTGHHCAQPLLKKLGYTSLLRASFSLYNTLDDVTALKQGLEKTLQFFS
ncbi:MAG: SufS family cysteine desulfurase [Candidatus Neomarinimicrobiota bacterium]|nr:MAG: SufS family cysteine desulfurase [Candidatus Neomarinimicrobiota bacterium]